jgi:hypothetical protein
MAEFSDESTVDIGMTHEPNSILMRVLYASCAGIANIVKAMNDAKQVG